MNLSIIAKKLIPLRIYSHLRFIKGKSRHIHELKSLTILKYKEMFKINVMIETGTYLGDMVHSQLRHFSKIISIELDKKLHRYAQIKFKKYSHIEILQGDSSIVLKNIIPKIKEAALFWLDGHYSGGISSKGEKACPIYEELDIILKSGFEHVLLIDDADSFIGDDDYPKITEVIDFIKSRNSNYIFDIKSNILIAHTNFNIATA